MRSLTASNTNITGSQKNGELIERWDNVPHHREIDTFPHHKHDNKGVYSSSNVDLKTIIDHLMDKLLI